MPSNLPTHIAIIPDGNRRWAKREGLRPEQGHQEGFDNFDRIMEEGFRAGIRYMTFWAASESNLTKRSPLEVRFLVSIMRNALTSGEFEKKLQEKEVSLHFFGRWDEILGDAKLTEEIRGIEQRTAQFQKFRLTVLFGYDGRSEMIAAVRNLQKSGEEATRGSLEAALWTGNLPPVDLVIRTGEEELGWSHWSAGFMMWQAAEAQLYFTKTFWPEFNKEEFQKVLGEYAARERRLGK